MTVRPAAEEGSAPAEFVLASVLLVALVLGVLQLGAVLLVRNTAQDAVAEGARWAAVDGNGAADGIGRARQVLAESLGPAYTRSIRAGTTVVGGIAATEVVADVPLPVIGPFGSAGTIEVRGRAALEPRG